MRQSRLTLLRVFVPFSLGYFFSYLYRVVNAIIAFDLVADIGLTPADLGFLTATYFLAFAAFQLPLGVLLDRYGSRRVVAILLIFAAMGAFVFARAESMVGLVIGRALIGLGVSACLMGAFTAFVLWFPRERLPFINGMQMAAGGMGMLSATAPVERALQYTDWRGVFMALSIMTLAVVVIILFVVPERERESHQTGLAEQLRGIAEIYGSMRFWRIAPLSVMTQSTFLAIQGLWAGPWLRDVAGLDSMSVANVLFLSASSMIAGVFIMGGVAERLGRRGIHTATVMLWGMLVFMITQAFIARGSISLTVPLWILFGFFGPTGVLSYAILAQKFPPHLGGRANTCLNLFVFVATFVAQWGIGIVINRWPAGPDNRYAMEGYEVAFTVIIILQIVALLWYVLSGVCHGTAVRRNRGK